MITDFADVTAVAGTRRYITPLAANAGVVAALINRKAVLNEAIAARIFFMGRSLSIKLRITT